MSAELIHALEQIEKERGINKEVLIEAIEVHWLQHIEETSVQRLM